ncbi:PREDICTED: transcription termination factor MTEF1, chloroplastic [Tarenaya hassleriana]|uniref:transcription termination factor MTEF1, chloroplastic n=1 Tax=Tarenaya hassleriana TaxID=28532 RepID=UPI00053C73FE|nr:PREDICTED: transcription termination factor MTEF1, chloroplastic [Tarenaya hassleriana]
MQETLPFLSHTFPSRHHHHSLRHDFPSLSRLRSQNLPALSHEPNASLLLLPPSKSPDFPCLPTNATNSTIKTHTSDFREKLLYLDSIGIDFLTLIHRHPPLLSADLSAVKSIVEYMTSGVTVGLTSHDLCRVVAMCPELLTSPLSSHTIPIITFLLREVGVDGVSGVRYALCRRPRLLACDVDGQLRPAMYFLQRIGISETHKHTYLLSCSVEHKLIPRIDYFVRLGFSRREATVMFRRFPQLFNYSISGNYDPKTNYLVVEMGRDLKEIMEFPQYFSFSLENRIKPRHQACAAKGVRLPLPMMLKTKESGFRDRLEVHL